MLQVKNKAPAEIQITAEQLLREAKERDLEIVPPVSISVWYSYWYYLVNKNCYFLFHFNEKILLLIFYDKYIYLIENIASKTKNL